MDTSHRTLYEILGVEPDATIDLIKQMYRKLSLKHHPDRGGNLDVFKSIVEAFSVLSDDSSKAEYDATGQIPKTCQQTSRVESGIAAMVMDAFIQDGMDPITWMLNEIDHRRSKIQGERSDCERILGRLKISLQKFLSNNEASGNEKATEFISMAIEARIQDVSEGIAQATLDIDHLTAMTTYLNGLSKSKTNNYGRSFSAGHSFGMFR